MPQILRRQNDATGSAPPGAPPSLAPLPPDVHPPPDALGIEQLERGSVAGATPVLLGRLELPSSRAGVVRVLEMTAAGAITTATDVRFTLVVAGAPSSWCADARLPAATGNLVTVTLDQNIYVPVPAGAEVELYARVMDPGTYDCSFRVVGWSWGLG